VNIAVPAAFSETVSADVLKFKLGRVVSTTVTVAILLVAFPLASLVVTQMVFAPRSPQVNVAIERLDVKPCEQLSDVNSTTDDTGIVTEPCAFKYAVWTFVIKDGLIVSYTITFFATVVEFPFKSTAIIST
jgi:hypothetical protein